jgi:hypothetical protein
MVVQHLIVPLRLAAVPVHGIADPFWRHVLEMHRLPGKWAEARGDEEQPGEELWPVLGLTEEVPGLFGEVDENRRRIENANFLPPEPSVSTMAGTFPLGLMARKPGRCC